jgi:TPP-dependent 2-oxoacid decarboxylase
MNLNWGEISAWGIIGLSFASAVGYAVAHDWRRALYFLFATCITLTVAWK